MKKKKDILISRFLPAFLVPSTVIKLLFSLASSGAPGEVHPDCILTEKKKKKDLITIIQSANPFIFLIFDPHLLLLSFFLSYT